ncbi:unnamed protein product [Soboliphyme baturini]|uniref:Winged helix-turn-helix domain-containing protein n=1 Tax=Soboliphyme baturini TaxID=241478 RepID=A0A183IJC7_9BILA|nr:unnamed protein product [Soboliphyme baturini]
MDGLVDGQRTTAVPPSIRLYRREDGALRCTLLELPLTHYRRYRANKGLHGLLTVWETAPMLRRLYGTWPSDARSEAAFKLLLNARLRSALRWTPSPDLIPLRTSLLMVLIGTVSLSVKWSTIVKFKVVSKKAFRFCTPPHPSSAHLLVAFDRTVQRGRHMSSLTAFAG